MAQFLFRFDRPFFWPAAGLNPEPRTQNLSCETPPGRNSEQIERRTSNVQRRTSNIDDAALYLFKKKRTAEYNL